MSHLQNITLNGVVCFNFFGAENDTLKWHFKYMLLSSNIFAYGNPKVQWENENKKPNPKPPPFKEKCQTKTMYVWKTYPFDAFLDKGV